MLCVCLSRLLSLTLFPALLFLDLLGITTLHRSESSPVEDGLILMTSNLWSGYGKQQPYYVFWIQRHVIIEGQSIGRLDMRFTTQDEPGTAMWVRPYFDLATKELRLQGKDGADTEFRKSLMQCATAKSLRPLLHLAHHEGLLDKVPGMSIS